MTYAFPAHDKANGGYLSNGFVPDPRVADILSKFKLVDPHVHGGPDAIGRYATLRQIAHQLKALGYAGLVGKNHEFSTANAAVEATDDAKIKVVGSVVLNRGLNPSEIMDCFEAGGRVVWMPSTNALNEPSGIPPGQPRYRDIPENKLPAWAKYRRRVNNELSALGIPIPEPTYILKEMGNEDSGLIQPAMECLEVIASKGMVLATSHLSRDEGKALFRAAKPKGVKVVATHPDFPSQDYDVEEQVELAKQGATLEQCAMSYVMGRCSWEKPVQVVARLKEEKLLHRLILGSDFGAKNGFRAEHGMKMMAQVYHDLGVLTWDEFDIVASRNAADLFDIKLQP